MSPANGQKLSVNKPKIANFVALYENQTPSTDNKLNSSKVSPITKATSSNINKPTTAVTTGRVLHHTRSLPNLNDRNKSEVRRKVTIYNNLISQTEEQHEMTNEEREWMNQFIQRLIKKEKEQQLNTTNSGNGGITPSKFTLQKELNEIEKVEKLIALDKSNKLQQLNKQIQLERDIDIISKIKKEKQEQLRKIKESELNTFSTAGNHSLMMNKTQRGKTVNRPLPSIPPESEEENTIQLKKTTSFLNYPRHNQHSFNSSELVETKRGNADLFMM
ncbi:hypothetical protein ABK040_008872 [Willaertia magna]